MKKTLSLLALLVVGCTAEQIPQGVTPREPATRMGTASIEWGREETAQPPTEAGTWLIYFAEQGMELGEIVAIFGPPSTGWKGPLDWRTSNDRWELHQWDDLGVWVETGWDDGTIRDMGFGKVIRFYGGDGPGY